MNPVIPGHVENVANMTQTQLHYRFPPFPTVLHDITNRIVTFSDIHGDLDALIVCLRDCANVIHKPGFNPSAGRRDPELDMYFDMDINHVDYDRSLGYEWRPEDTTFVVIIGDLIDPVRNRANIIENIYHRQIELKIIHFINALNESALRHYQERHPHVGLQRELPDQHCGRIYKLLGNHDLLNFASSNASYNKLIRNYTFEEDIPFIHHNGTDVDYYDSGTNQYTRSTIFRYPNPGFNAYFQTTGTGVALIINDNLFIHGGLTGKHNLNDVKQFHYQLLRSTTVLLSDDQFVKLTTQIKPLLEVRHYYKNNDDTSTPSVSAKQEFDTGHVSCELFSDRLEQFCGQDRCEGLNPKRIRMFKGHCTQSTMNTTPSTVLSGFIMNTGTTEMYSNYNSDDQLHPNAFYHGDQKEAVAEVDEDDEEQYHPHNRKWGVTLSCDRNTNRAINLAGNPSPQIIKVDVGMGRGQDNIDGSTVFDFNTIGKREKTIFESRVPQVIIIPEAGHDHPERLILIRSTLKHMAIHMPRPNYSAKKQDAIQQLVRTPNARVEARIRRSVYGKKPRRMRQNKRKSRVKKSARQNRKK